jgi:single-stranded DNA-binding protein
VKGKLVYIEGRLKTRIIDKEDGTKLHKTEVVVGQLIFLSKREDFAEGVSTTANSDMETTESFDDFSDLDDKF